MSLFKNRDKVRRENRQLALDMALNNANISPMNGTYTSSKRLFNDVFELVTTAKVIEAYLNEE